jgi:hypothetical protein
MSYVPVHKDVAVSSMRHPVAPTLLPTRAQSQPSANPSEAHASGGHSLGLDDFLSTAPKSEIHTIGSDANHIGTDDARHARQSLSHLTIAAPIRSTKGRESYEVIKAS